MAGDREAALSFLEPLGRQISSYGLGTLGEIFDGDAPFTPEDALPRLGRLPKCSGLARHGRRSQA